MQRNNEEAAMVSLAGCSVCNVSEGKKKRRQVLFLKTEMTHIGK